MSIPFDERGFYRATDTDQSESAYDLARASHRRGELVRLRRGVYAGPQGSDGPEGTHRRAAVAALYRLDQPAVISHESAALFWGLPLLAVPSRVHVTTGPGRASGGAPGVLQHRVPLDSVEVVEMKSGIPVTCIERTLFDVLRTSTFEAGVVVLDAALASRWRKTGQEASRALAEAVRDWIGRAGSARGTRIATSVVAFADARSESPGESFSRARMAQLGFVVPDLQHEVRADGRHLGRVDFWWPEGRIVGEFDGAVKYGGLAGPGGGLSALLEEKRREDGIRRHVDGFARWGWKDALEGRGLAIALRAASVPRVGRSRRPRFV